MKKKNFKLFFDMDDTLADFSGSENYKEGMRKKGFFKNLIPLPFQKEINKLAALFPENIYIVSACMDTDYCKKEKITWLKKYLPFATKYNVIFTNIGENKAEKIKEKFGEFNQYFILIDDWSNNIYEWEKAGGTALKFQNKYNNKTNKEYSYTIKNFNDLLNIVAKIRAKEEEKHD